ncbi:DUF4352 domain-containing protein [Geodermatophilus poikilotrophus]|uniref:DUF4352 domain-containing protein n=1 Tax=Geodermatophilus poikilotrophus TaxID=1333667 RepID=A0A1I0CTA8_9ACTN|nr:DUF4352 domain-containing protein [Geodermatophilus poikilotrophus]SET23030.1 protein of unknown function [Geodermatophilus poikilotrophus]
MSQSTHAPADPQGSAPQPPAKKPFYKRAWFIVIAVLVVIAIAQGGGGDGESASSPADSSTGDAASAPAVDMPAAEPPAPQAPAPETPGIGEPAADGKFNFIVNGVDCSATEIGSEFLSQKAQGQFCIVDLTITNVGDRAQSFFGDNATLLNEQGQQFSADSEAAIYLEDSSSLYEEINPGNTLASKVVFDVPAGTVPTSIELHDSAFSGGVTVNLQ